MNDLERRLRDAMTEVAEQPPPGLMDGIRRRHRRHLQRVGASWAAAVAAIVLIVPAALHSSGQRSGAPAGISGLRPVRAAPGTILAGCSSATTGQVASDNLPRGWRRLPGRAGPVWFLNIGGRGRVGGGTAGGNLLLYVTVVVIAGIKPGSAAVVTIPQADRHYLRFLYGPGDSLNPGTAYTMRSGEPGVTFEMCPLDGFPASATPITDYNGGVLIAAGHCVPVDVLPPGRAHAIRISLGACR